MEDEVVKQTTEKIIAEVPFRRIVARGSLAQIIDESVNMWAEIAYFIGEFSNSDKRVCVVEIESNTDTPVYVAMKIVEDDFGTSQLELWRVTISYSVGSRSANALGHTWGGSMWVSEANDIGSLMDTEDLGRQRFSANVAYTSEESAEAVMRTLTSNVKRFF